MNSKDISQSLINRYKKSHSNNDNIYYKEIVKQKLLGCEDLMYALNCKEMQTDDAPMDAYYGTIIRPNLAIPQTQHSIKHFLLYDTSFDETARYSKDFLKYGQICFIIMCSVEDIIDKLTGIARHDLIAAIIQDEINWSNAFGTQIKLISDKATITDTTYATRTLIFEQTTTNGVTRNGRFISSEVRR